MKNTLRSLVLLVSFLLVAEKGWGQQTAIYTVTSTTATTQTGTKPTGAGHSYSQTFSTAKQITNGNSATLTLAGYAGYKITNIVLEMRSNTSSGRGTLSVVAGSTSIASVSPTANFNTASWYGAWSTSYVDVSKTPTVYSIGTGENVVITIAATANSLYIQKYSITYEPVGYAVTFNSNGGTGTMANQTASTATALTANAFTRSGYTFTGWNITADGSGTAYANNASFPFTANATLYAQWVVNSTPTFSASALTAFGSQCINNTYGPNSFTITGSALTSANVTVSSLTGYTFSTTSGGTYTASLSLIQSGGAYSQQIFVRFQPVAITSYNGNIVVGGGGASNINVTASGSGTTPVTQAISSSAATAISFTTATLNGNLTTLGVCPASTERGFVYSETDDNAFPTVGGAGVTKASVTGVSTGTFTLGLSGLANSTEYSFRAYVYNGTTYTYGAILTFPTLTPITNDDCSGAIELTVNSGETCSVTTNGTLLNATSSLTAILCNSFTGVADDDVWYKFTATGTTHDVTVTPASGLDIVVDVRSGSCNGTNISCADEFGNGGTEQVTLNGLTPTAVYYVRVYSYTATAPTAISTFSICVTTPLPICLNEGFDNGTTAPSGWVFIGISGTYTTSGNFGNSSPSIRFDDTNDRVETPILSGSASELSFWLKGQGTSGSSLLVQGFNGSWTTIENITAIPTSGTIKTYNATTTPALSSGFTRFRFTYTKSSGNLSFDDVKVKCINCTPPSNPTGTIAIADNPACGATSISYTTTSPTDVLYYWQTTALGTSLTNDTDDDFEVSATGTYYVRTYNTATQCWSDGSLASSAVTIINGHTTIAPSADQSINTGNNGSILTVTEGSASTSRKWKWSTTSGTGYVDFTPAQTGISYTPNFATAGEYYIICESTYPSPCSEQQSNEVKITVIPPGPPVINHTSLGNTSATSNRTVSATITSSTSYTCTPFITYRINGGSWVSANGTNTSGNNWSFTIPGQLTNTQVEYFISACNSAATVTAPANVNTGSVYGVFNEYTINCVATNSDTKTIAFQGFEFVSDASYTFSVDNTAAIPTSAENYPAHSNATEWRYYNQGANGSLTAANRNSCGCMAETFSGLPGCPNPSNPIYTAGGSTGICRAYSGNSRGVYINTSAAQENPANSRSRNGNYAYIHQSRNDGGDGPYSFIYFDDVEIPDAANATNIKVIGYVSSISTSTLSNGAESADKVTLSVKYNSNNNANSMVNDITCGSDWYFYSSSASGTVSGTTNSRWDYAGNTYNTSGIATGTTTNNKIVISVPDGTTNVRAMIRILNDDQDSRELWAVDDIQIIADYAEEPISTGRYFRTKQNGRWESGATWESATTLNGTYQASCVIPDYLNSDTIIISNTDTVRITDDLIIDQTLVSTGGKLILSNGVDLTINNQATSADLLISGVYEDNATTPYGIDFINSATWKLNSGATIIKTSSSTVLEYKDNFEGGIATIPADAHWYYNYNGNGNPSTLAAGMFYPNLYFDNTANTANFSFNTSLMALTGSTGGFCTIKGNLNIGTTGTGSVTIFNNNLNSNPMLVNSNVNIGANSTLTNEFCSNCGTANGITTGNGTGFEVLGDVTVNGTLDIDSSATGGILLFSGTTTQNISGIGTIDVWNVEIDKQINTAVNVQNDVKANKLTDIKTGILNIESNNNYESRKVILSTINSKLDIKLNAAMYVNP